MKPLLIVNPRSGGGRTGALFDKLREPIERALGPVDVALTERGRHAVDLARDAALDGRAVVVAVGGDGSIHEVVNGLMEARDRGAAGTKLGIIGQGTGGDFRKALGLEHRLDKYCQAIAAGKSRPIDVGRFSYTTHAGADASAFFMNILSAGIGGLVDQYVAEMGRSLGGTAAYFVASLKGLLKSELGVLRCTITHQGKTREEELRSRLLAVCNGSYFGSGMHVAPMARLDDGVFEVIDMGDAPRARFAWVNSRVYTGDHLKYPDVRHFACSKITVELANAAVADRFLLDVDGEPLGRLPMTIEVVPRALEVFAP